MWWKNEKCIKASYIQDSTSIMSTLALKDPRARCWCIRSMNNINRQTTETVTLLVDFCASSIIVGNILLKNEMKKKWPRSDGFSKIGAMSNN